MLKGLGFMIYSLGYRVQRLDLGLGVQGLGFRVQGLGFVVHADKMQMTKQERRVFRDPEEFKGKP